MMAANQRTGNEERESRARSVGQVGWVTCLHRISWLWYFQVMRLYASASISYHGVYLLIVIYCGSLCLLLGPISPEYKLVNGDRVNFQ